MLDDPRIERLLTLGRNALNPAPGAARIALALCAGLLCHTLFAAAIFSMMFAMYHGLSRGMGVVPAPWSHGANLLLILQFPLLHSLLLTRSGSRVLAAFVPGAHGRTLSTTTYATIASIQLLALFWLWTPSGVIWWQAEGGARYLMTVLYTLAFAFLGKAIFDAGAELQSGALGWLSLLADRAPRFPDMPTLGLFRVIRQPIYLAFACTLWTVPIWTPDQLLLAALWTAYCVLAPRFKEARFERRYGERWERYRGRVPYFIPRFSFRKREETSSDAPAAE
jgi:protein-S-isoprenylcysteine O-methyltransferase Ste14